jgi:fibronectin type 3 domain-containing protein
MHKLQNKKTLILFVLGFAAIGILLVVSSYAATYVVPLLAADGTIDGDAAVVNDSSAASGKVVRFGLDTTPSTTPIRAAFYYPWFPSAWNQQGLNPFTQYHPSAGFYSSADAAIVSKHIDAMTYAGMNAAIYSWWGQGSTEDSRFTNYLQASHAKNLKWAPYYECEGNATGGACTTLAPTAAQIQSDLAYIKTHYASDPNYLHIQGKPVIFAYGDPSDNCATADNWSQANANEGFYVVLKVFTGFAACASQPDNWHQYAPAVAEDNQPGHSIAISPSFYKANEPSPRLTRNLTTWQQNVTDLKNSTAPLQLVTTFNEWGEGSSIESATEWASASGYGQYIDILHNTLVPSTADTTPPSAPTNLVMTSNTVSSVGLSWAAATDDTAVTHYEISRGNAVVATIGASTTSYNDTTVASGTAYAYTVKAIDGAGNKSAASNTVAVTTPQPDTAAPSVPTGVTASLQSPTANIVHIGWNASTDTGGSGLKDYVVTRNGVVVAIVAAPATAYDDTATVYNTTYSYTVTARDNLTNTSTASTVATITTPVLTVTDTQAPDVPGVVASVVSPTQVTISWTTVQDNPRTGAASGVKGYKIFRGGVQIADVAAPSNSTNDGPFSFVTDQSYSYTVLAYDAAGNNSVQSTASSVTPSPRIASGSPCGTRATPPATYNHIVVVMMENKSYNGVIGTTGAPYETDLAKKSCASASNWQDAGGQYNSLSNYIKLTSGLDSCSGGCAGTGVSTWNDCNYSATSCHAPVDNLFRQVRNSGKTAKSYQEGMTSNCGGSGASYAQKHNPQLYYDQAGSSDRAACAIDNVSLGTPTAGNLINDINANTLPAFSLITPNLCNDTHDCSVNTGDVWLQGWLPKIFNSTAYKSGDTAVFVVWDEDTPIPNIVATPSTHPGTTFTGTATHSGILRTWEEMLGIPTFLGGASSASSMRAGFNM